MGETGSAGKEQSESVPRCEKSTDCFTVFFYSILVPGAFHSSLVLSSFSPLPFPLAPRRPTELPPSTQPNKRFPCQALRCSNQVIHQSYSIVIVQLSKQSHLFSFSFLPVKAQPRTASWRYASISLIPASFCCIRSPRLIQYLAFLFLVRNILQKCAISGTHASISLYDDDHFILFLLPYMHADYWYCHFPLHRG